MGSKEGLAHSRVGDNQYGGLNFSAEPFLSHSSLWFCYFWCRFTPRAHGRMKIPFFEELERAIRNSYPKPKMLVLNFPSNPTGHCVEIEFFRKSDRGCPGSRYLGGSRSCLCGSLF